MTAIPSMLVMFFPHSCATSPIRRGEWLPHVKLPGGGVRYRLNDVLAADKAGNRGFTFEEFSAVLSKVGSLDGKQRTAVMEAVRKPAPWMVLLALRRLPPVMRE